MAKILIPLGIVAAAIVGLIVLSGLRPPPQKVEPLQAARVVEVMTARRANHQYQIISQGSLAPATQTDLVAEVSGKVVWVSPEFVAGGFFAAGQALLKIDPSDYEAQLKQAEATLASRQAQLAREEAQAQQAVLDWNKLDSRRGQKPSPLVLREPQLAEAQANVKAAEAELDRARRNLQRTNLSVPYAGLVLRRDADLGQFLSAGSPVGTTFAIDYAEVRLPLSTEELAFVDLPAASDDAEASEVPVLLETRLAGKRVTRTATLARSEQVIDQSNRAIYAVARLNDPYGLSDATDASPIPIGAFVSAAISGRQAGRVFQLPREVVRDNNEVMVVGAENLLELRPVTIQRSDPAFVYVSDGLTNGDRIITTPIEAPIPGTAVRVVSDPPVSDGDEAASNSSVESPVELSPEPQLGGETEISESP
ncbi:MAG: efflux RND transporter periplasmic adaptor subunit [Lysobacterales bacterium]